ncbi:subtilisin-like protease 3 [Dioscorea cayenensis subsp. rotundata]|uniref:Subtilisin-like protease 3 n=1 Tax=Dioscorea cayennensis subsp. rotundata TaxID=55577 RepID=A0AB40CTF1_DIOCR|nr:subtilisin-like protease 3 [Dioscorea cayenensis subsp. rotundata]
MLISYLLAFLYVSNYIHLAKSLNQPLPSLKHTTTINAAQKTSVSLHQSVTWKQNSSGLQTYIVLVHPPSENTPNGCEKWYKSFLPATNSKLIYSYTNVVSGFAAKLTHEDVEEMKTKPGFVHAYPDRLLALLTTHTPDFLGISSASSLWNGSNFGQSIIIGVLDTGVLPTHPSFNDQGMPPPPAKWKGVCQFKNCNNKLIGARNYVQGQSSKAPFDNVGHGTHTASTAGGMFVKNSDIIGQATGTAAGMAPYAHLAMYKVCTDIGCYDSDILAGMDAAVSDGVDILSLSLGGSSRPFYSDSIAIGAFGAVEKGVIVSCAAGNSGPSYGTLSNEAPWILTVGASTINRVLRTTVKLGNGQQFNGESAYQPQGFRSIPRPLVYPGSINSSAATCKIGSLKGINVRGKVVICDDGDVDRVLKGSVVKKAGGVAMILANQAVEGYTTLASVNVLPASHVSYEDGLEIKTYISSNPKPMASIFFQGTLLGVTPAPVTGYFTSRGPNQADPSILKPDIIGPGVNILAAWPFLVGAKSRFNMISGTSMATPHLTGIAALLKHSHPDWSPAAIKSAIMTSSEITDNDGNVILDHTLNTADFFTVGAGHVNPSKANYPGLVYDIKPISYVSYLCGLNYTDKQVSAITRRPIICSTIQSISGSELNYPSFMVFLTASNNYTTVVHRTVTNVGLPKSTYTLEITPPPIGVSMIVNPKSLKFTKAKQELQFSVTFSSTNNNTGGLSFFETLLTWVSSDKSITVRSPVMVGLS